MQVFRSSALIVVFVVLVCGGIYYTSTNNDSFKYIEVELPQQVRLRELQEQRDALKEALVAQGYSDEVVESLLIDGAQKATALQNIASVYEQYGVPWNLPLNIADYELVALYLVGNDPEYRFILGQYVAEDAGSTVFAHMGVNIPITTLQASLSYNYEQQIDYAKLYLDKGGRVMGFYFRVEPVVGNTEVDYVVTASSQVSQSLIDSFIGSVVDGKAIRNE